MILHLKELMGVKDISSVSLAEKLGVSKATISYWINGKVFPDPDKLQAIADALDVEVWELFKDPTKEDKNVCLDGKCPHCGHSMKIRIE